MKQTHSLPTLSPLLPTVLFVFCVFLLVSCRDQPPKQRIGVIQWTEAVQPYTETYRGIMDSLADKGYRTDLNIEVDYHNAEQNNSKALEVAQYLVDSEVDLIISLGTGSSIAALQATRQGKIPIVFSIVGAPQTTGIISSYEDSGANITGVSMEVDSREQLEMIQEILPGLSRLAILYCTSMPQATATGKEAFATASSLGLAAVEMAISHDDLPQLSAMTQTLATSVEAIYIPTDPILGSPQNLQQILAVTDAARIPVFGVAPEFVKAGVLAALHCDYYEIGRQSSEPIIQILNGMDPQTIPSQKPLIKKLSINLNKARQLNLVVARNVILKADNIID